MSAAVDGGGPGTGGGEQQQQLPFRLIGDGIPLLDPPKRKFAAGGALVVHLLIAGLIAMVPWTPRMVNSGPLVTVDLSRATPLVAPPPKQLSQRDPQVAKPALEVNLQGLLAKQNLPTPPPKTPGMLAPSAPKRFEAPPVQAPPAPKPVIEAPKLDIGQRQVGELEARGIPGVGNINAAPPPVQPPPQIQPEERSKLSFEKPGASMGNANNSGTALGRIPVPQRATLDEAGRQAARSGGGGLTVGDLGEGMGGLGDALNNPGSALKNASQLELLSDPQGVDFKPYLIRILSTVRRNWFAVMPESARMGRRGKVLIQFAINKDGSVPKLVISSGSGAEALDRAAVAGISASNPFPPLPDEFRGGQVRLQFSFAYNMPR